MPIKNQTYEVEVIDLNNLGYGVARIDGVVTFIDGGVTGDRLLVKIIKSARDYAVARIEKILLSSPYRVSSDCVAFPRCGGCSFRHIEREYELKLKRGFVENAFRKAGIAAAVSDTVTDGVASGYRNKVQYPLNQGGTYGYYARHSHTIVPTRHCSLAIPVLDEIAGIAVDELNRQRADVKHLYLRCGAKTGQVMVCPVCPSGKLPDESLFVSKMVSAFPGIKSIVINRQDADTNVILGQSVRVIFGTDQIEDELCGCRFAISSLSFYQVNRGMAELLYREAIRRGAEDAPHTVADLYCGAGTIGIAFAKAYPDIHVYGVEIVPDAVRNAKMNAERNGVKNAEFVCADAMAADLSKVDCLMVDPPRKGMSAGMTEKIIDWKPRKIVYVSCNPETLARDAARLIGSGYRIGNVTPFDLFPRTGSCECVTDFIRERG